MTAFVRETFWLTVRQLKLLITQPTYVIITFIQPVIWLFLFGNLFRRVVELPGFETANYLDYLVPGVVVMNALSTNIWAGTGTLEEIERGTLNRFLILPVHRAAIMNANVVRQAISTLVQSVIIIGLGFLGGATFGGGILGVVVLITLAVVLGATFGAFSNMVGMLVRQRESIVAINTFLLLPLAFLSTVFMARGLMPDWMQTISRFNPLDWAATAGRSALDAGTDWSLVASRGLWLVLLAAAVIWLSTRTFRSYRKSV